MSTIVGGLLGLGGSLAPSILDFLNKKEERKHLERIRQLELDAVKLGHEFQFKTEEVRADVTEAQALLTHDQSLDVSATATKMAILRASVRPIITYAFFGLFFIIKVTGLWIAWKVQNVPLPVAMVALWDNETSSLFAAIMGFWFGQRAIGRMGFFSAQPTKPTSTTTSTATTTKKPLPTTGKPSK